jgi:hypothetical protein
MDKAMTAEEKVRLVEEIKAALNEAANTVWRKCTMTGATWTRECFAALEELGRKAGYSTASSASRNGWLYDLIWWVEPLEGENAGRMTDLVLALESEWKTDLTEIRRDFQKLVQTRALIKVMVTDALNAYKRASLKRISSALSSGMQTTSTCLRSTIGKKGCSIL